MSLMIWCTCAQDNKEIYLKRVSKWYEQVSKAFSSLNPEYYCFVDGQITEEDKLNTDISLLNVKFINIIPKIGRNSIIEFQGWKRSFKLALEYGRNYDHILHMQNDVKILHPQKIINYLTKPGYYLGYCKTYGFVETALMILNDKEINEKFIQHYSTTQSFYQNEVFEFTFQNITKKKYQYVFETDRVEGNINRAKPEYDYLCQYDLPIKEYKSNINIFSAATTNYVQILKLIIKGLKKFKKESSNYTYTIVLDTDNVNQYYQEFKKLQSESFKIKLLSTSSILHKINPMYGSLTAYIRCLIPYLFPKIDKVLYLDSDIVVAKEGIENLFEQNIDQYYCSAVQDLAQQYVAVSDVYNTQVSMYFNSGVMLFNNKKIREDGLDKILLKDLQDWPEAIRPTSMHDQTLLNYRFNNKVNFISQIYNNFALGVNYDCFDCYTRQYKKLGWNTPPDSIKDTVIFHYAGAYKPWSGEEYDYIPWGKQMKQTYIDTKNKLEK